MPLHKDYKLRKPIVWKTQILKNKCQTGKDEQAPLQAYPPTEQPEQPRPVASSLQLPNAGDLPDTPPITGI